jgi:hypothetical protein
MSLLASGTACHHGLKFSGKSLIGRIIFRPEDSQERKIYGSSSLTSK